MTYRCRNKNRNKVKTKNIIQKIQLLKENQGKTDNKIYNNYKTYHTKILSKHNKWVKLMKVFLIFNNKKGDFIKEK